MFSIFPKGVGIYRKWECTLPKQGVREPRANFFGSSWTTFNPGELIAGLVTILHHRPVDHLGWRHLSSVSETALIEKGDVSNTERT